MSKRNLFIVLTITLIGIIIASVFIAALVTRQRITNQLTAQYSRQSGVFAHEISVLLQTEVEGITDKLNLIAQIPDVRTGNYTACQRGIENAFTVLNTKVGNIGRVNKEGVFQCSLNKALIGVKAETLGAYITQIFQDPDHKPVLSRTILPPGSRSYIQAIHVPVYDNANEFIGTLGGAIYIDQLQKKLFRDIKLTDNSTIVLIDDDGTIIYHQNPILRGKTVTSPEVEALSQTKDAHKTIYERAMSTERAGISRYTFDEVEKVVAFESFEIIPGRKWIAMVTVPIADINKTAEEIRITPLFWGLITFEVIIVTLAALLFMWFLIRQFGHIDRAKDEFISIVSHQLRTPLTAIRLYSEMLSADAKVQKDATLKENIDIIHTSTKRMIKLVNDILNVSRIQLGSLKVDPQPVQLEELVKNIVEEIKPTADAKKVTLSTKFPRPKLPILNIDESLIRQVIHNLITNSIRYTHPGTGTVSISLVPKNNGAEITVTDNGIGIPLGSESKIFSRFYRADNAVRHDGDGTGLGMYMAKMIVDIAHGTITFKSIEGKGTTFQVYIPKNGMIRTTGTKSLT